MGYATLIVSDQHNNYTNKDAVDNLIRYVFKEHVRLYGGLGIDLFTSDKAIKQMKKVKKLYRKTDRRQMYHFILSFDDRVKNPIEVYEIGMGIIDTFFYGYQVIFTVHEDTDHLHLHFILNSVNMLTGYKWHMNGAEFREFKNGIETYADDYLEKRGYDIKYADYKTVKMSELL